MNAPIGSLAPSLLSGNCSIQRSKELRPIGRRKWRRASGDFASRPDLLYECALRESQADRVLRKGATIGATACAFLTNTRPANGISLVTATSPETTCSAIQSSATSAPAATIILAISGEAGFGYSCWIRQ